MPTRLETADADQRQAHRNLSRPAPAGLRAAGRVLILGTARHSVYPGLAENFRMDEPVPLPESNDGVLWVAHRC